MCQAYNFNAGPAILPKEVLKEIKRDLYNWKNLGISILETSHRHPIFMKYLEETKKKFRTILKIPNDYHILFCHGGARGQFSAIPMNLLYFFSKPDYINSGYWSLSAAEEAKKYCSPNIINVLKKNIHKKKYVLNMKEWKLSPYKTYMHYCPNETIHGIEIFEEPIFLNKIIVGDFSSTLLSREIDIKKYGIIYACSQKNIGPAGITIVIVRDDLIKKIKKNIPSIWDYYVLQNSDSLFNTPTTFSIYVSGLMLKWIHKKGGLKKIEKYNYQKARLLYKYINSTEFYENTVIAKNQSLMNVTFNIKKRKLEKEFIKKAEKNKLYGLKGHVIVGGLRASLYNAMSIDGVKKLIKFMQNFEKKYG